MISPPSPRTTSPQAAAPSAQRRPPSTCARTRSGLTVMPQSSAKTIRLDADAAAVVEGDLDDLGAVAVEEAAAGDAARVALGQRRSPAGAVGGQFERPQRARVVGQQVAAQVDGVAAGGDGELVDRRLAGELGVRVADRPPHHDGHAGLEVGGLQLEVGQRVRAVDGAARRHVVDAVLEQEVDRRTAGWARSARRRSAGGTRSGGPAASAPARTRCTAIAR